MVSCLVPEDGEYARQIDLLTPMPWTLCKHWADTVVGHRGEIYEQQKQRTADECIRLAERVIPGLRDMVKKCYTSTPLTWRDYPNLFLTGQSLVLHGVEGVTMTAFKTLEEVKKLRI